MSKWKVLESSELFKSGFLRVRTDKCELPDGRVMPRYYVMEFPDWVNVVAITKEGMALVVDQYRHAAETTFLEIPGGSTDLRQTEDPRLAAERELLEETGYQAGRWMDVGFHFPNPATQQNKLHTYIAFECVKVQEPHLDPYEDLSVRLMPLKELYERADRGEVTHSLILSSLALARQHLLHLI
ncbi:MAG: NUDIX hydrolase [Bdellovibrionaceae bacterium]|nr:NUDIX hydrolase [Bdellovibrionales bacterium]MCB9084737.1 NUDIX hydrolase [Pseudobdellovibrionaceae bacterium]